MPARLQFDLSTGHASRGAHAARNDDEPLRLLLLGDFSGRPTAERPPLAQRPTYRVDFDNLDALIKRLAPRLLIAEQNIGFTSLDDFHPDSLYARLPLFQALRDARNQPPSSAGDLLGSLLGTQAKADSASTAKPATGIEALIRSVIAPHIVPDTSAETRAYTTAVDTAIAEQMRALLHAPAFQALESAWRSVNWLINNLELDENLQLHLFDVTREELLTDVIAANGQLAQTGLHAALADRWRNQPGGEGWSLLSGLYRFGPSDADIGLLAALGLIASQAGGPFIATGDPALAGKDPAPLTSWHALRQSEAARWIGLTGARMLLRLPYGKGSDPIDAFSFDEFKGQPEHEELLWGAGSVATALLIGRAFSASGWAFEPGDERQIDDLPAYTFTADGESHLQACAEHYLGEQAANAQLAAGLIPLLSHRHANAITVMRFQSIADPAASLAGLGT